MDGHASHQRFLIATIVFDRLLSSNHFNNENDFSAFDLLLDLVPQCSGLPNEV